MGQVQDFDTFKDSQSKRLGQAAQFGPTLRDSCCARAAHNERVDTLQKLLELGAGVDALDSASETALEIAQVYATTGAWRRYSLLPSPWCAPQRKRNFDMLKSLQAATELSQELPLVAPPSLPSPPSPSPPLPSMPSKKPKAKKPKREQKKKPTKRLDL